MIRISLLPIKFFLCVSHYSALSAQSLWRRAAIVAATIVEYFRHSATLQHAPNGRLWRVRITVDWNTNTRRHFKRNRYSEWIVSKLIAFIYGKPHRILFVNRFYLGVCMWALAIFLSLRIVALSRSLPHRSRRGDFISVSSSLTHTQI